eukprot:3172981-Amphidinium_carterae.1
MVCNLSANWRSGLSSYHRILRCRDENFVWSHSIPSSHQCQLQRRVFEAVLACQCRLCTWAHSPSRREGFSV